MKIKTINTVITKKFSEFANSITDEPTKKLVLENSLISGGCIASMLSKEKVNDYDIYFTNKQTVLAVAKYFSKKWSDEAVVVDVDELSDKIDNDYPVEGGAKAFFAGRGISEPGRVSVYWSHQDFQFLPEETEDETSAAVTPQETKPGEYKVLYCSPNAISLSDDVQLIIRFYGSPADIHKNYDYVHCTNYWLSKDGKLYLNQPALEAIISRELIYVGSKYPVASVLRTRKFIKRGYTINAGMYLKMLFQVSALDLTDIPTLYDQLVGVDVAYFIQLLEILNNAKKAHANDSEPFKITYAYISEIIDRIF